MRKLKNEIDVTNWIMPILVGMLLVGFLLFVINSVKIVSEKNKNNFAYTVKVRDTSKEIDKIVERAEVNVNTIHNIIKETYDINQLYDKEYNINFVKKLDILTKSVLINTPGVNGAWYQCNANLPFYNEAYSWYSMENGKIVNYRNILIKNSTTERPLTPETDPYYFEAINNEDINWSDIYIDPDSKVKMLTISQAVYKDDQLIGVVGIDISTSDLQKTLTNMQKVVYGSEIFLLDKDNQIILYQLAQGEKANGTAPPFIKLFENSKAEGLVQYKDRGIKKTAIKVALSNKYSVVMAFHDSQLFSGFGRLFRTVYLIFIIMAILSIVAILNKQQILKMNKKLENETIKLRTIIDSSPNMIVLKNIDGIYVDCNNAFENMIGIKKEDLIGKTAWEVFGKEDAKIILECDKFVIQNKKMVTRQTMYKRKDEEIRHIEKYVLPLFNYKKELKGILVIAFDITKQQQEQELLRAAKEAAEKAVSIKSNFLANMSHEIRTPMNGVLGFLQLLKETETTPEQEEFIEDAQKSSEMLLQIINDILDFSKIEADKLKIDEISFDLHSIIDDITVMTASLAQSKNLEVNSLICSDVPQYMIGDPIRVKQILNNIVNNAIKFTNNGEVTICVSQIEETPDSSIINFDIKDTGIGIEKEKLDLIFEEFSQADGSTTRKFGGTGLGLSITKKLVNLMNGKIRVESQFGKGSTFTVTLPLKKDADVAKGNYIELLNDLKILVIDSNLTNLKIIDYYLSRAKCVVYKANSKEEVTKIIDSEDKNISVVIIDEKMENEANGEISSIIKTSEKFKNVPIILCTSLSHLADFTKTKGKGFFECIAKPIKKNDLIMAIAKAIYNPENDGERIFPSQNTIYEDFNKDSKILVVEDNEINLKLIQRILHNHGLSCDMITNGRDAIEAFKVKDYDLILMDCQMPILSGYEATKAIRKIENGQKHTPIVAMTANVFAKDEEKCYETGMDEYISKPIKIDYLLNIIGKYLKINTNNSANPLNTDNEISEINEIISKIMADLEFSQEESELILSEFIATLSQSISEIEKAINSDNFEKLKKPIHKLKGSSSNLRIDKISSICTDIEEKIKANNKEACISLIEEIKDYSQYLIAEMLLKYC